ncbi:MAG: lysophospholipid acyltransferase family protein [Anaerovoracaceae bacterium]|nr:lysophospholipid acyltransferase family protein [Bacillota bacterium]MDY2670590.1 lysophospholipid acyltransferase family protein [Anaerovoracaceae bacterium]
MRSIIWLIRTVIYLLAAEPDKRRIHKLIAKGDTLTAKLFTYSRVRHWALAMLRFAGVTVEVHGLENIPKGPVLYVPNHQSDWDIMIMESYIGPCGILAKKELSNIPIVSEWMRLLGAIFIDRENARESVKALMAAEKTIKSGEDFVIFPEGTRSRGEEMGEFKSGAFRVAFKTKCPIVPVSIDGSYKIMEANNGKWIKPGHVIMTVLPPIETKDLDKSAEKTIGNEIRAQILEARMASRKAAEAEKEKKADR